MGYTEGSPEPDAGGYRSKATRGFGDRTIVSEALDIRRVTIPDRTLRPSDLMLELSREEKGIMLYVNAVGEDVFEQGPFADESAGLAAYGEFKKRVKGARLEVVEGKLNIIPTVPDSALGGSNE